VVRIILVNIHCNICTFFPKISLTQIFSLNLYLNAKRSGGYIIKYVFTAQDYSNVLYIQTEYKSSNEIACIQIYSSKNLILFKMVCLYKIYTVHICHFLNIFSSSVLVHLLISSIKFKKYGHTLFYSLYS
jgi:hypothetical protein